MGHQHALALHLQLQPAGWIGGGLGEIDERALGQEHQQGDTAVAQRQPAGPAQPSIHIHRCFAHRRQQPRLTGLHKQQQSVALGIQQPNPWRLAADQSQDCHLKHAARLHRIALHLQVNVAAEHRQG